MPAACGMHQRRAESIILMLIFALSVVNDAQDGESRKYIFMVEYYTPDLPIYLDV